MPLAKWSTDVQAPRRRKPYRYWRCSDALGHFLGCEVPERRHAVLHIVSRSWLVVPVEVLPTASRSYDDGAAAVAAQGPLWLRPRQGQPPKAKTETPAEREGTAGVPVTGPFRRGSVTEVPPQKFTTNDLQRI
jgi:hypothetical protein